MSGWQESTVGIKSYFDLPQKAQDYIRKIEALCQIKASIISTGPKREETICQLSLD
jgi:adenylosuccinate synthase